MKIFKLLDNCEVAAATTVIIYKYIQKYAILPWQGNPPNDLSLHSLFLSFSLYSLYDYNVAITKWESVKLTIRRPDIPKRPFFVNKYIEIRLSFASLLFFNYFFLFAMCLPTSLKIDGIELHVQFIIRASISSICCLWVIDYFMYYNSDTTFD